MLGMKHSCLASFEEKWFHHCIPNPIWLSAGVRYHLVQNQLWSCSLQNKRRLPKKSQTTAEVVGTFSLKSCWVTWRRPLPKCWGHVFRFSAFFLPGRFWNLPLVGPFLTHQKRNFRYPKQKSKTTFIGQIYNIHTLDCCSRRNGPLNLFWPLKSFLVRRSAFSQHNSREWNFDKKRIVAMFPFC